MNSCSTYRVCSDRKNELERALNVAVVALFRVLYQHWLGGTEGLKPKYFVKILNYSALKTSASRIIQIYVICYFNKWTILFKAVCAVD
jgi:hypothetical protein